MPGVVPVRLGDVLGELLAHEQRFWVGSAQRAGLLDGPYGMTPQVLRQIVAANCLLGAATKDEAERLLARVPDAVAAPRVAGWLSGAVPAGHRLAGRGE